MWRWLLCACKPKLKCREKYQHLSGTDQGKVFLTWTSLPNPRGWPVCFTQWEIFPQEHETIKLQRGSITASRLIAVKWCMSQHIRKSTSNSEHQYSWQQEPSPPPGENCGALQHSRRWNGDGRNHQQAEEAGYGSKLEQKLETRWTEGQRHDSAIFNSCISEDKILSSLWTCEFVHQLCRNEADPSISIVFIQNKGFKKCSFWIY